MQKKLEDMNLLDNFLFGETVTYPGIGEEFTKILLRVIFRRKFKHLHVFPQKIYYGSDAGLHGTRLDVYIEEGKTDKEDGVSCRASVYDIEPDKNDKKKDVKSLPRRVRFYHSKIDSRSLNSGELYDKLKNVAVIMIMPYDPFGLNRMVYTVKNRCIEEPGMPYDDGALTLFLYTQGTEGNPDEELKQLLNYMENTTFENAVNSDLQDIHKMIETVKKDSEVSVNYMRLMEDERILLARGEEKGRAEGRREGELKKLIAQICRKLKKAKSTETIAEELEEDITLIRSICETAGRCAPEYDVDKIYELLEQ